MKDTISSYEGATNLQILENQLLLAWQFPRQLDMQSGNVVYN